LGPRCAGTLRARMLVGHGPGARADMLNASAQRTARLGRYVASVMRNTGWQEYLEAASSLAHGDLAIVRTKTQTLRHLCEFRCIFITHTDRHTHTHKHALDTRHLCECRCICITHTDTHTHTHTHMHVCSTHTRMCEKWALFGRGIGRRARPVRARQAGAERPARMASRPSRESSPQRPPVEGANYM